MGWPCGLAFFARMPPPPPPPHRRTPPSQKGRVCISLVVRKTKPSALRTGIFRCTWAVAPKWDGKKKGLLSDSVLVAPGNHMTKWWGYYTEVRWSFGPRLRSKVPL